MSSPEEIARVIEGLNLKREDLVAQLGEIDGELAIHRAHLARHENEKLPVSSLPYHLLTDILLQFHYQELNLRKVPATPKPGIEFIASQVSFRWREAVLSTPLFWRTIRLQVKPPRQEITFAHFKARLARSHNCPLDIYLDLQSCPQRLESQFYHAVAPHSERWRKLSLITEDPLHAYVSPLLTVKAPNLELLAISIRGASSVPALDRQTVDFGSTKLTTVRIGGLVTRKFDLPLTHVTTLHLAMCPITVLHNAPATLQHLSLNDMISIGQLTAPIQLPNLISLRVISNFTGNVVNWLSTPQLLSLTLDQLPGYDWTLDHSLPTVKHLGFNNCSLSAPVVSSLLSGLPGVESLCVNGGHMERLLAGLAAADTSDDALYFRRLRRIGLFDIDRRTSALIGAIVFVRSLNRDDEGEEDGDEDDYEGSMTTFTTTYANNASSVSTASTTTTTGTSTTTSNNTKLLTHITIDNRTRSGIRSTPGRLDWLNQRVVVESVQYPVAWPGVFGGGGLGGVGGSSGSVEVAGEGEAGNNGGGEGDAGDGAAGVTGAVAQGGLSALHKPMEYPYIHPMERAFWESVWNVV